MFGRRVRQNTTLQQVGVVGIFGLVATTSAGILQTNPDLRETVAALASWLVEVIFQVSAVLGVLVGLLVIAYSHWNATRGTATERVHRVTAMGVLATYVLFFGLTLVLVQDVAMAVAGVLSTVAPPVPPRLWFDAGIVVFGTMALLGFFDVCKARILPDTDG